MKVTDLLGSEIGVGDLVSIKQDHLVGVVAAVETGDIVRGLSLVGPKPEAHQIQPHIVVRIEMTGVQAIMPNGSVPVLKIAKPSTENNL
jgi:hypothetical protein